MKSLSALLLVVLPLFALSQADSAWIVNNYTKIERMIPMRDGKKLFTSIYLPKDKSEKHPILMMRTPYGSGPYGENKFREFWRIHLSKYMKENYISVVQDVRGKYMSEGEYMDIRPFNKNKKDSTEIDEASDTYDTVEWLIKNLENNNGKVGVLGISYPGFYATQAALSNHPAVVAVSPQAPVTDWFIGDDFHHNGAFMLMDAFQFYIQRGFGTPRPEPTSNFYDPGYQPKAKDTYKFFLETGALPNFTKLAGDTVAFWKELMSHPNMDDFWVKRNARVGLYDVKPAMLVVGGLFDAEDCFGAWNVYKAMEKQSPKSDSRIVMGPWAHGQWGARNATSLGNVRFGSNTSAVYQDKFEVPFFKYHLEGEGSVDSIKDANIFFSGENTWKEFDKWPPATKNRHLYFQGKGKLDWKKSASGSTSYVSDPAKPVPYIEDIKAERTAEYMTDDQRFAAMRPDVLVFQTDTLTEDVTVAGPVIADLRVALTGTDADFVVKVIDVFPDEFSYGADEQYLMSGYQMLVRGEVFRGKFRNSFAKPEPFVPGKVTQVKYELPDIAHTFKKGHRIMVQVQSSWFPLVDRNPQKFIDIYHAKDSDFQKATIKVFHDAANGSSIILPVME